MGEIRNLPVIPDINAQESATVASTDELLIADASDGYLLKKVTAQSIGDLGGGGGGAGIENPVDASWKIRRNEFSQGDGNHFWGELPLIGAASTGASVAERALASGEENRLGIVRLSGGSTYAGLYGTLNDTRFGDADHRYGIGAKLVNVPDATDDYLWWAGYSLDNNSIGTYMSCFGVDRSVNATNFIAFTIRAGARTNVDTGIAFDTSWHNFEIVVNAANTSHTFYIDGSLVATISTNMPNASLSPVMFMDQTAGASRSVDIDWMYQAFKPATARGSIHTWIS